MQGIIIKAISGFYYVSDGAQTVECKAKGAFRNEKVTPLVGDRVEVEILSDGKGVVKELLPRKNFLARPPVANIEKAFIVSSFCTPAPNTLIIDTMISLCEYKKIIPVLLFNKDDLGDFEDFINIYKSVGYKAITCSAKEKRGIEEIKAELKNSVSVFTGNSGVGKSSILNEILPEALLQTGEISQKLGRGRHTTRHTELFPLPFGGYVADTAGFSSIEADKTDYNYKLQLEDTFKEFGDYLGKCRFTGCSHIGEKGCAVCEAVEQGKIQKTRYESYLSLFDGLKDLKEWQIK